MASSGTILLVEPKSVEGDLALNVSYGHVTEGMDLADLVREHNVKETVSVFGPKGIPLEVHICEQTGIGPIFVQEHVVFGPVFITAARWEPLHCDECGRIAIQWFASMQPEWQEKYHAEWRSTYGSDERPEPQRLN